MNKHFKKLSESFNSISHRLKVSKYKSFHENICRLNDSIFKKLRSFSIPFLQDQERLNFHLSPLPLNVLHVYFII